MPKGKTKVKFVGGVWDGEAFDEFDTRMMHESVAVFSDVWAKKLPDGNVGLMRSEQYGNDWIYYQNHRYRRNGKDNNGYFIYQFKEEVDNYRCEYITKEGNCCKNIAIESNADIMFCKIHAK